MRLVNRSGFLAVVVTNQAGVARGYFPESLIHEVHARCARRMEAGGARLDGDLLLPAPPVGGRAAVPPGLRLPQAAAGAAARARPTELGVDLARSWVVGDRHGDLRAGLGVGARGVLVKTGYGLGELEHHAPRWPRQPDLVAEHLLEAVERILAGAEGAPRVRQRAPPAVTAERLRRRSSTPSAAGACWCWPTWWPTSSSTAACSA